MNPKTNIKLRLIVMNYLIFAVWGSYLCSLGIYLSRLGMGAQIGQFFAIRSIVFSSSLFAVFMAISSAGMPMLTSFDFIMSNVAASSLFFGCA